MAISTADFRNGMCIEYNNKLCTIVEFQHVLYSDGTDFNFMDMSSFEQLSIPAETVGSAANWLKENDEATLMYAGDELISIEPPMFVELEVTETEPGFKGDTATNTTKPATLETGVTIQVPTFVEIGDVLQIDSRDGRFVKRV